MDVAEIQERFEGGLRPFLLRLADGRKFRIEKVGDILLGPGIVAVMDSEDRVLRFEPDDVIGIEDLRPRRRGLARW